MKELLSKVKNIHLVGIGGVGMSGLALLLKDRGFLVSGSDVRDNSNVKMLRAEGIKVFIGHDKSHLSSDTDILGYSSAVSLDNPEITLAKTRGIDILGRGEFLAKLCEGKKTIAVAGSHGKTTTTSLLGYLLTRLNYKPAVFVGGLPLNYSKGAWWGDEYFVIETDESDGSFLHYEPWYSVITNIDREHLQRYRTFENLKRSFLQFALKTKEKVIGWGDDTFLSEIIHEVGGISFGWGWANDVRGDNFRYENGFSCFDLYIGGELKTTIKSPLRGEHNCLNVLAVFAFFHSIGEDLGKVKDALLDFKGTRRRFEVKEVIEGVTFVDDYAHHPTEIEAVLAATKLLRPKRIFVVLQLHRFSRVGALFEEFCRCLFDADKIVVTDIYSAHEENIGGIDPEKIVGEVNKISPGKAEFISRNRLSGELPAYFRQGDIVLGLGAGDINKLMEKVRDEFKKNRS